MYKFLVIFFLAQSMYAQTINENHELLWEISGNGLSKKSYLFGSFHSNDRRLFNWTDSTYIALAKVDGIALETDVFSLFDEYDTRQGEVVLKYDSQGKPYSANPEATLTAYGDEDGMPQFLDAYIQQYCINAGKTFHPLESVDLQLDVFGNISLPSLSEMRLEALLVSREDLIETYLKGDIYGLDEFLKLNLSLSEGLYESLIVERNFGMANKLDSILKTNQSIFCAVGGGHLAGGSGMINLLRSKGYSVRSVGATWSDQISLAKVQIKSASYYTYENDTLGFSAQFPSRPQSVVETWDGSVLQLIYRDFGQGNTYSIEVYELDRELGLEDFAEVYIASPSNSPAKKIRLSNGGEAYEGISDAYPEGSSWVRVVMGQDYLLVLKAYGGNKFMNSPRAKRFFDTVSFLE